MHRTTYHPESLTQPDDTHRLTFEESLALIRERYSEAIERLAAE